MGSWLAYTAVPHEDLSLQTFSERVNEALYATDLKERFEPVGYREFGVVSERVSETDGNAVKRLFGHLTHEMRVLYLVRISDTSDSASISVYEPTRSGQLGQVGYRSGNLLFEDRDQYDDRFDERAAAVREYEDPRMGTYSDDDHVTDLKVEYGGRPLFHYR